MTVAAVLGYDRIVHEPDAITARQRLVMALLLAFCIDTLRPVVHPAAHEHPGGELPHVHAGDVVVPAHTTERMPLATSRQAVVPAGTTALAAASGTTLHVHLFRSAHVAAATPPPAAAFVRVRLALAAPAPRRLRAAAPRRAQARSPPPLSA